MVVKCRDLDVLSADTQMQRNRAAADGHWEGWVSVIVPIYNEAEHVEEVLRAIESTPVWKQIIIVDDGSTDGTRDKLLALPPRDDLVIIFREHNRGKGAAIRTALQYAQGEYVVIQDSDLEYDPQDYVALLQPLRDGWANVVCGVRPDWPGRALRFFLGAKLLPQMTNLLYGASIHGEGTCYKAFRRSLLSQITLACNRFEFCPEVTAKICRMKETIAEVPISFRPRSAAEGKNIRHSDGWLALWTLIRYRFIPRSRWIKACGASTTVSRPHEVENASTSL